MFLIISLAQIPRSEILSQRVPTFWSLFTHPCQIASWKFIETFTPMSKLFGWPGERESRTDEGRGDPGGENLSPIIFDSGNQEGNGETPASHGLPSAWPTADTWERVAAWIKDPQACVSAFLSPAWHKIQGQRRKKGSEDHGMKRAKGAPRSQNWIDSMLNMEGLNTTYADHLQTSLPHMTSLNLIQRLSAGS